MTSIKRKSSETDLQPCKQKPALAPNDETSALAVSGNLSRPENKSEADKERK